MVTGNRMWFLRLNCGVGRVLLGRRECQAQARGHHSAKHLGFEVWKCGKGQSAVILGIIFEGGISEPTRRNPESAPVLLSSVFSYPQRTKIAVFQKKPRVLPNLTETGVPALLEVAVCSYIQESTSPPASAPRRLNRQRICPQSTGHWPIIGSN